MEETRVSHQGPPNPLLLVPLRRAHVCTGGLIRYHPATIPPMYCCLRPVRVSLTPLLPSASHFGYLRNYSGPPPGHSLSLACICIKSLVSRNAIIFLYILSLYPAAALRLIILYPVLIQFLLDHYYYY